MMPHEVFPELISAVKAAEDAWFAECDAVGIICGHKRRCLLIFHVLATLAEAIPGPQLPVDDLINLSRWVLAQEDEGIKALQNRLQAAREGP